MNKKTIFIGLGVLAVAGIGYYMWKKKNETTSGACGCSAADGEDEEESSNAEAGTNRCEWGYTWYNGGCHQVFNVKKSETKLENKSNASGKTVAQVIYEKNHPRD